MAQRLPHQEGSKAALNEIAASVHSGSYIEPTKQTLAEFTKEWLIAAEPTIQPATHFRTPGTCGCTSYLASARRLLRRVDAGMLNALYAALPADGKQSNGGGGPSPSSVHYVHTILR